MELVVCGRRIGQEEIEHVVAVTKLCSGLRRWELARTVCEHLGWVTASGKAKVDACVKLLEQLESAGRIQLREKQAIKPPRRKRPRWTKRTEPRPDLCEALSQIRPVKLQVVTSKEETRLWKEYVDRYHYLGWKQDFGCRLHYFIQSRAGLLGCVSVAGAAKSIAVRDRWIGWTLDARRQNLPWIINNSRFVLFPWVHVPHLASHILGQLARQIRADWDEHWGYRPLLMETFVDPARYQGTCYRAAGWTELGETSGSGRPRRGQQYTTTPKRVFVRVLVREFRRQLCSAKLTRRVDA